MKLKLIIISILSIFLFFTYSVKASVNLDSLKSKYYSAKTVNERIYFAEKIVEQIKYIDPNGAIQISDSIVNIINKNNYDKIGFFYEIIASSNWHLGLIEKSNVYFNKALQQYIQSNNLSNQAEAYNNIAYNYFELGNYTQALNYLNKAYKIASEIKNDEILAITTTYLGQVNVKIKNYTQAFNAYSLSASIFKKAKKIKNLAIVYNNIGNIYIEQNNYDSAATWFLKSYNLSVDSNYLKGIAIAAANLGLNYLEQKQYAQSAKFLNEAHLKFQFLQNYISLVDVSTNIIRLNIETNQLKNTQKIISETEPLALQVGSYSQLLNFYKSVSDYHSKSKNYGKAFYYGQLQLKYTDSLANENALQLQNEMAAKFQNQLLQDKVDLLVKNNILKDTELERKKIQKKYFIVLFISSFFVLILLIVIIVNKNKSQQKLKQQNDIIKNALAEREVLLREIHHRVKNNLQIVSSLLNLQHGYAANKSAEEILKISESRIQSMALIHEKLYKNDNFKEIDFKDYILNFIENIKQSYSSDIDFFVHIENVNVDIDQLVPCGLILHELIINSIKHGFEEGKNQNKKISIIAKPINSKIEIEVFDNGKGLPIDFSFTKYKSLGIRLIKGLVAQLKGDISFDLNYKGAYFKFYFNFVKTK